MTYEIKDHVDTLEKLKQARSTLQATLDSLQQKIKKHVWSRRGRSLSPGPNNADDGDGGGREQETIWQVTYEEKMSNLEQTTQQLRVR